MYCKHTMLLKAGRHIAFIMGLMVSAWPLYSQEGRLTDNNNIGWFTYTGTFKIKPAISLHTEYQWRRVNGLQNGQQNVLRTGINFHINPKLVFRVGYANIETYSYGDFPLNAMGKRFTERRLYQAATITDRISIVDISHRFMLEQRWVGRYSNTSLQKEDDWVFTNRLRYMFRMQWPFKGKSAENKTTYAVLYDELFIGFGKNVAENVFDQNRLGVLVGYRFSSAIRIEGGYLSQVLQLGREINNRNIFQYNNGIIINSLFSLDFSKASSKK